MHALYEFDLLDVIRERVQGGMPYFGASAGANITCPTIMTTNDMPIIYPPSFDALNLIPFQINPHYLSGSFFMEKDGEYVAHRGETRDQRLNEYHQLNKTPVLGMYEGSILRISNKQITLTGPMGAKLLKPGGDAVAIDPETDLSYLLEL